MIRSVSILKRIVHKHTKMNKYINGKLSNKKVIRRKNKEGYFTTVNYQILRDKRLNSNAKILLIEILSDTDGFRFSETLFIRRMAIGKSAYYNALKNLEECGYVKKSKIKNTQYNYYTVSELGNLIPNKSEEDSIVVYNQKEIQDKLGKYFDNQFDFFTEPVQIKFSELIEKKCTYHEIKPVLEKSFLKEKTAHFNEIKDLISSSTSNSDVKVEAIKLLKKEVFNNNSKTEVLVMIRRASANINRRKPTDPESLSYDRADGV